MNVSSLHRHAFSALGCTNEIQIYAPEVGVDRLFQKAVAECRRIESKFSRFRDDSIVSQINRAAGSVQRIEVDEEVAALLNYADAAFRTSDGLFDITSGILSRLWNFREMVVPSEQEIATVLPFVGWDLVEWTAPTIRLPFPRMEIDFGGIGKEYAVDRLASILLESGIRHGMVNLGGDLRILGPHPDGKRWNIGISHPRLTQDALATVGALEGALATSGDYERYFEIDGVRYCHIINPKTGMPAQGVQAVTVFSQSCTVAGTACTTAMLYGPDAGKNYLDELGCPYIFVRNEHSIVTKGFTP